jgi:hypothetical protein
VLDNNRRDIRVKEESHDFATLAVEPGTDLRHRFHDVEILFGGIL